MGRGTYPGCPWHFKVGQLGYRGLLYGVFDRFLGSVWVPPMGPFRLDMGGYAQDTCGGLVPTPRGCPWQLTCPSTPHPDGPPGLYRHVLVDFDVCTTGPKMVSRSPNLRPMWPQHPPKGIRWLVWASGGCGRAVVWFVWLYVDLRIRYTMYLAKYIVYLDA